MESWQMILTAGGDVNVFDDWRCPEASKSQAASSTCFLRRHEMTSFADQPSQKGESERKGERERERMIVTSYYPKKVPKNRFHISEVA